MHRIKNFREANQVLAGFVPKTAPGAYTLDRIQALMEKLGNPQNSYKIIHVAGTSGKTSTSYYIASLLQQSRKKVGLTVSPHVDEVNERVQVNIQPLPEPEFCKELSEFIKIIESTGIKPTYFELLIAFAYWEFARQKVNYAVVEVGLGGLLDGTNVVSRPDKVCVITDIGLDHTSVLGTDLASIAAQKAGIIKDHNTVFCFSQEGDVMNAIKEACTRHHGQLYVIEPKLASTGTKDLPLFQQCNWYLAKNVADYVLERDGLTPLSKAQLIKSRSIYIPARMEIINRESKTIVLDGSHNPQKVHTLVKSLQSAFPGQKMSVVLGLLSDKEVNGVIGALKSVTTKLYATSFRVEQDMPRTAMKACELAQVAKTAGIEQVQSIDLPEQAFKTAIKEAADVVLVTGSFFLLNHIRPLIFKS